MTAFSLKEDSLDPKTMGRLQVTAGAGLLRWSHLIRFDENNIRFQANTLAAFKTRWTLLDPILGRLTCWIAFSVGAEYFAKGICLMQGLDAVVRNLHKVLAYPSCEEPIDPWAEKVLAGNVPKASRPKFATLGELVNADRGRTPPLELLAQKASLSDKERKRLIAGYRLLAGAVRNRDAHFYTPGVRESHFYLVERVFVPCFNILVGCLPGGADALAKWLKNDRTFISDIFG